MIEKKKRTFFMDTEGNNLFPAITKLWCAVFKDKDTGEKIRFYPNSPLAGQDDFGEDLRKFLEEEVDVLIGHNIIGFDMRVLNALVDANITVGKVIDTLVLSRLFRPVSPFADTDIGKSYNRVGGHSLGAWGRFLGFPKTEFDDWSKFSMEQLEYCENDVDLVELIYNHLMEVESEGFSEYSIRLEHKVADILVQQEIDGFHLDQDAANKLVADTGSVLAGMDVQLQELFPPIPKLVKNWTPKVNKDGTLGTVSQRILKQYEGMCKKKKDGSYDLYTMETFNPQSGNQIAERLLNLGWKPKKFTPTGKPKTDKDSLNAAIEELSDYPAVEALSLYNIVADRNAKARKWLELVGEDGCVHGRINPIGAGTHRCSHFDDNMANIARVITTKIDGKDVPLKGLEGRYGWDARACWIPAPGLIQVGADASGIQLRGLAHYMNDTIYTQELLIGDIHEVNRVAAGIDTRPRAKTFIYSWLMGAGDEKIGIIVGVKPEEYPFLVEWYGGVSKVKKIVGKLHRDKRKADEHTVMTIIKGSFVKQKFLDSIPSLKRLKEEDIPKTAKDGYLVGLDGRKIWIPNEHFAMSIYLQSFEAIVMKLAIVLYQHELKGLGIPFKQRAFVHDECQMDTSPEFGEVVGKAFVGAIERAGVELGSNCPLTGEFKIGRSWAECH